MAQTGYFKSLSLKICITTFVLPPIALQNQIIDCPEVKPTQITQFKTKTLPIKLNFLKSTTTRKLIAPLTYDNYWDKNNPTISTFKYRFQFVFVFNGPAILYSICRGNVSVAHEKGVTPTVSKHCLDRKYYSKVLINFNIPKFFSLQQDQMRIELNFFKCHE